MTYRVRKQALTGKMVLQIKVTTDGADDWRDVQNERGSGPFEIIDTIDLAALHQRIAKYERRAAGQRKAAQARAERAKPVNPEPQQ